MLLILSNSLLDSFIKNKFLVFFNLTSLRAKNPIAVLTPITVINVCFNSLSNISSNSSFFS